MPSTSERGEVACAAKRAARGAICATLLFAVGCASGPTYEQLQATLPALAPGQGRILVFLTAATEVPSFFPQINVDDVLAGELRPNTFFYVDRPEGLHVVGVHVKESNAAFGSQGATEPVEVPLVAGEKAYIEADATSTAGMVVVTLTRVSPADGERDLAPLYQAPQPAP